MSDDRDVTAAVQAAGYEPTPKSRDAIRSPLMDEIHGGTSVLATPTWVRDARQWWTLALAGATAGAASVAVIVAMARGDDAVRIVPSDTAPTVSEPAPPPGTSNSTDAPTTLPDRSAILDELVGHRWIAVERDGEAWPLAYVPYLDFESSPLVGATDPFLGGNDGCNWYGAAGSLDGDRLAIDEVVSTAVDCGPGTGEALPLDGDRVVTANDGATLALHDPTGRARLVFARLDTFSPADMGTLHGTWQLDASTASNIDFDDGDAGSFGTCRWSWKMAERLTVTGWPDDPYSCLGSSEGEAASRLIEMLVGGPVMVRRSETGTVLYLSDDQFVIRLTRLPDPDGISGRSFTADG